RRDTHLASGGARGYSGGASSLAQALVVACNAGRAAGLAKGPGVARVRHRPGHAGPDEIGMAGSPNEWAASWPGPQVGARTAGIAVLRCEAQRQVLATGRGASA